MTKFRVYDVIIPIDPKETDPSWKTRGHPKEAPLMEILDFIGNIIYTGVILFPLIGLPVSVIWCLIVGW
jgi:hypothetical protein